MTEGRLDSFIRKEMLRSIAGTLVFLLIVVVIWSLLSHFLPEGWWHLVINIGGIVVTGLSCWVVVVPLRTLGIRWAPLVAGVIWAVMFVGVRTLVLTLLEMFL